MLEFTKGAIYKITNAGCGRQKIFFQKRNYQYFKEKIKTFLLPYAEILSYQLKVNEFRIIIRIKQLSCYISKYRKIRTLAESIGIMLRSYAQAINKQENRKGVLWQGPTKAELQENAQTSDRRKKHTSSQKKQLTNKIPFEAAGKTMELPLSIETLRLLSRLQLGLLTKVIKLKQLNMGFFMESRRKNIREIDCANRLPISASQSA